MSKVRYLLVIGFIAFCMFAWTKSLCFLSEHQSSLIVENDKVLGNISAGDHKVQFEIFNSSYDRTRTILEFGSRQSEEGSLDVEGWDAQPLKIPPREKITVTCTLKVAKTNSFELVLPVLVDDGGRREIMLFVRGTSIAPASELRSLSLEQ